MQRMLITVLPAILLATGPAAAQMLPPPDPRAVVSLLTENDTYAAQTDRWYTNGFRLGYSSAEGSLPAPLAWVDRGLGGLLGPAQTRWGLALGQNMYTPVDKRLSNPDPRDRPYAGYLYGEISLDRRTETTLDRLSLQVGVVGPSSLARPTQDVVHNMLSDRQARGWHYQLQDEPVFNLGWDRTWRVPAFTLPAGLAVDALPTLGVAAGTVQIYAAAGARVRLGQGLNRDFGPPRIRPTISDAPAPVGEGFGWYVFAGAGGRAVARDIFLDGNTWRDSRSVDHRPFVGDLELGVAVFWHNIRLSYTQDWRSKEFVGQSKSFHFGALSLSVAF
ncbi:lipid A deacylase LpxR family protein [Siccirubricoccus sp. G192]|uniref:lipid A deacylase LpxR family protein n=1 Tax=Siccirubricoccus sp. G192 TaxID=2849651 RepID=UPI001C2CAD68|nr:lipid A deacylase LpxR family protein [Siccirubricoccus sp. G192]MBV1798379.1 lipid A deacylase LpxR family protein [Siccirubricoccus sp. G192]